MSESIDEQYSRVEMMVEDNGATWDLSPNDKAAIKTHVDQLHGVRDVMERWAALQGHDRCWNHEDILRELCSILKIEVPAAVLPSREAFVAGCEQYQRELYGDGA